MSGAPAGAPVPAGPARRASRDPGTLRPGQLTPLASDDSL